MIEIITEYKSFLEDLKKRGSQTDSKYAEIAKNIVNDVLNRRDEALLEYTKKFDNWEINKNNIAFSKEDLKAAFDSVEPELKEALITSKERIWAYQEKEMSKSWFEVMPNGEILGSRVTPLEVAGIYVPGGKASYPSSVLMNAIPAKVAGVKKIVMATPTPNGVINPLVLAAAYIAGVDEVYKIGGAQAIAAMAYGTKLIPKVDKIVGPGNIFVALAKREVFGSVGIDSIAGPSEILIVADETANPRWVAADLLSQAEHDEIASGVLVTNSMFLAKKVKEEIKNHYDVLSRKAILDKSLPTYCKIIVVKTIEDAIEISNSIAPEHLELALKEPFNYLSKVKNAGAIFLGHYTPEALGDYMAGANHVLPTSGTARFFSPLGVNDFLKKSSIISFNAEAFEKLSNKVSKFARAEGLDAHALSVEVRNEVSKG